MKNEIFAIRKYVKNSGFFSRQILMQLYKSIVCFCCALYKHSTKCIPLWSTVNKAQKLDVYIDLPTREK